MIESPSPRSVGQRPLFVGVDVGGTNIKIGLIDAVGRTLACDSMGTESERGPELACQRIGHAARRLAANAGASLDDVARVGLATPGPFDRTTGILLLPGNLPGWWSFPLRERASHHLGRPVTLVNDGNAATYGEHWRGAGTRFHNLILLTLGTGIGGGIIVGGELLQGSHDCASECGYIVVDFSDGARSDALGKRGTLEAYASARAVVARVHEALDAGECSSLALYLASGEPITPQTIGAEAERGDRLAHRVVMDTAYYVAVGIVTLIHVVDPDVVMLGGAMTFGGTKSTLGREFLQRIRAEVRMRLLEPLQDKIQIEFASLGGDAGFIGAAGLARLDHLGQHRSRENCLLHFAEPNVELGVIKSVDA